MLESSGRRHEYVDRINRYQLLLDNWERPRFNFLVYLKFLDLQTFTDASAFLFPETFC